MSILVTGAAGFIGFHLCNKLLDNNIQVIGLDNVNNYYDTNLKENRIKKLLIKASSKKCDFHFLKVGSFTDKNQLLKIFTGELKSNTNKKIPKVTNVIHLVSQAGVRYSIENPLAYIESNIVGFTNLIEECKKNELNHFIYASSSSVYGGNRKLPFHESDNVDHPISLYAATKKSNELIAHCYSHLFNLPTTGLRFFTVYGPWGRPDMALFKFTDLIIRNKPINVFNYGKMKRDFTYIDDVVESILNLIDKPPRGEKISNNTYNPSESWAPYRVFNIEIQNQQI